MGQNQKTVIGVFKSRSQADKAIDELQRKGFKKDEINVITRREGDQGPEGNYGATGARGGMISGTGGSAATRMGGEDVSEGVTTGGTIGGLAGLLAGAGALAIPGIGPLLAAGPIAGALTGAVTGGVAGGLIDYGIPETSGRRYEEHVKQGNIVALVRTSEDKINQAALIFRQNGATDVETH